MKKTAYNALFFPFSKIYAKREKQQQEFHLVLKLSFHPVCCDAIATKTKSQKLKTHN